MSKEKKKSPKKTPRKKEGIQEKLLKRIVVGPAGPDSEKIVDLLYNKQNVNEFLIAKKMDLTINQTRNMLYKLADEGFVSFIRKKDKKKGGWYTYFWTLKSKKALQKFRDNLLKEIDSLIKQLKSRKADRFYYSPSIETEYTEEEAMLNDFTCPETGEVLELRESTGISDRIESEVKKLEEILDELNREIVVLEGKEEKAKMRRLGIEKKKKEEERKRRRIEREKLKAKEARKARIKLPKKKPKKKVKKKPKKKVKKPKKKTKKQSPKKHKKPTKKKPAKKKPKKKVKKPVKKHSEKGKKR